MSRKNGCPQKSLKSNFLSSMEVAIEFYAKFQAERHFYFLRGPPTFVWSLWKSKRKPLKWHAFWLSFFFLSFFLGRSSGKGMANFLGKTEVAIEFYAKFWAEIRLKIFPKNFFLLRQENFHFLKTFSLYLERADESWLWGFVKKMCWKSENFSMADFVNFMS